MIKKDVISHKWLSNIQRPKAAFFYGGLAIAVALAIIGALAIGAGGAIIAGKSVWGFGDAMKLLWVGMPFLVTAAGALALLPILGFMVYGVFLEVRGKKGAVSYKETVRPFLLSNKEKLRGKVLVFIDADSTDGRPFACAGINPKGFLFKVPSLSEVGLKSLLISYKKEYEIIDKFATLQVICEEKKLVSDNSAKSKDEVECKETDQGSEVEASPALPKEKELFEVIARPKIAGMSTKPKPSRPPLTESDYSIETFSMREVMNVLRGKTGEWFFLYYEKGSEKYKIVYSIKAKGMARGSATKISPSKALCINELEALQRIHPTYRVIFTLADLKAI